MMEITFEDKATSRINDTLGELDVVGNINEQTEQEAKQEQEEESDNGNIRADDNRDDSDRGLSQDENVIVPQERDNTQIEGRTPVVNNSNDTDKENDEQSPGVRRLRKKFNDTQRKDGRKASKILPNGEKIKGRYVPIEAHGVTASHDAKRSFSQSENFPTRKDGSTLNDRDYERDKQAQEQVRARSRKYDGRAVSDMPVVDKNGVLLLGNDRTMSGQLAAEQNTVV